MAQNQFDRIEAYSPPGTENDLFTRFKILSGNGKFRLSRLTFISLITLLLLYPGMTVGFTDDPSSFLKNLNEGTRMVLFISTIIVQWCLFLLLYVSTFREQTLLAGIGIKKIRVIDILWVGSFLLASNVILFALAWFLAKVGLPMSGEIGLLIPEDLSGRIVWFFVSFTAGFCEEAAFRGYLMTRLRLVGKLKSWVIPVVVSSIVFGACHSYQGLAGFIVISVYGFLFALLYIRTGSLWPCIIAHSLQDFGALFFPR